MKMQFKVWILVQLVTLPIQLVRSSDDDWMHSSASSLSHPEDKDHGTMDRPPFESTSHWKQDALEDILRRGRNPQIEGVAKNVIFFIGDGLSLTTISASRIYKGQRIDKVRYGEEAKLHVDTFPYTGLSKTYCLDAQTADSACSATAYLGGVKSNVGTIGVKPNVMLLQCGEQDKPENHVTSILHLAQLAGKSTGVVTNTRITHATPAGAYAHIANRAWEDDASVRQWLADPDVCFDIAKQLIAKEPGNKFNVVFGGGRDGFLPVSNQGNRLDGRNLIEEWVSIRSQDGPARYVANRTELLSIDPKEVDNVIGLFSGSHMPYVDGMGEEDPSLEEMVKVAISILSKNPNGYFLFVEGGRIDIAHHSNQIHRALVETVELDKAVKLADDMSEDGDTLVVMSSDHSHAMTFAGYHRRGNPILKQAIFPAFDGISHATLGYANGPGPNWIDAQTGRRHDVSKDNVDDAGYQAPSPIPMESETHGGEDVLIFAKGPYAHFFGGVHEQTFLHHLMAYAACIGDGPKNPQCSPSSSPSSPTANAAMAFLGISVVLTKEWFM